MPIRKTVANFCRFTVHAGGRFVTDPARLGALFRDFADIRSTPSLEKTVNLIRSFRINIENVDYLDTGGVNMTAKGAWYIHYSGKDRPATQKFTIMHELFEVIHKNFTSLYPDYEPLKEPQLSQFADRFAAAALIPPRFFLKQVNQTGCDLVKLSEELELSHQCLLIALGQHLTDFPIVGVLYEYQPKGHTTASADINDFVATVVVKTGRTRRIKELCWLQSVPLRNSRPQISSLVCAAVNSGSPLLYRSNQVEDSPAVLVRPLLSSGKEPYRVILVAVPNETFDMISSQVDRIEPIHVNGDIACPSVEKCQVSEGCIWKMAGGNYEQ